MGMNVACMSVCCAFFSTLFQMMKTKKNGFTKQEKNVHNKTEKGGEKKNDSLLLVVVFFVARSLHVKEPKPQNANCCRICKNIYRYAIQIIHANSTALNKQY